MTSNLPYGVPEVIFEQKDIAQAYAKKILSPAMLRNNVEAQEQIANGSVSRDFLRGVSGLAFYNSHTAPSEESSPIAFERNFNPMLQHDSAYFNAVSKMLSCVERNQGADESQQETVCKKEMKDVRMAAFKNELLYHNMNKRFYMDLIQVKRNEAPI